VLQTNSKLDSDPEALDTFAHDTFAQSSDSDSELDGDDEAFTGREHYEAVRYGTCKLIRLGPLLTRFQQEQAAQTIASNTGQTI
jgi:hypothetical protein